MLQEDSPIHTRARDERDWLGLAVATAAGLGLGVIAGMVAGELFGDLDSDRLRGAVRKLRRTPKSPREESSSALQLAVSAALGENPTTRGLQVQVRALGDGIIELTGTVSDPEARPLAGTVARGVAGVDVVVNRILVPDDARDSDRVARPQAT